jgi:hypothetical protein
MINFEKGLFIIGDFWDVHIYGSYLFLIDDNQDIIKLKLSNVLRSFNKSYDGNLSFNQLLLDQYSELEISNINYNKYQLFTKEQISSVIDSFFYYEYYYFSDGNGIFRTKIVQIKDKSNQLNIERLIKGYFTSIKMYKNTLYAASLNKGIYMIHFDNSRIVSVEMNKKIHSSTILPTKIGTIINSYTKNSLFLKNNKTHIVNDNLIKDIFTNSNKVLYVDNKFYNIDHGKYTEYEMKNKGLTYKEYQIEKYDNLISFNISNNILFLEYRDKLILLQNGVQINEYEINKDFIDWKIYPNSLKYRNHLHLITTNGVFITIV